MIQKAIQLSYLLVWFQKKREVHTPKCWFLYYFWFTRLGRLFRVCYVARRIIFVFVIRIRNKIFGKTFSLKMVNTFDSYVRVQSLNINVPGTFCYCMQNGRIAKIVFLYISWMLEQHFPIFVYLLLVNY